MSADTMEHEHSDCTSLEKVYVHDVYESTAHHFANVRYRAWPKVKKFLHDLEPGSLVADVGCGSGKYLHINPHIFKLGSDRCQGLVKIAKDHGHNTMVCDSLHLPYRSGCFDAVISIGVIHHFTTKHRRAQALQELARVLRPGGKVMIYVWSMEQKHRKFDGQDVLVPWYFPQNTQECHSCQGKTSSVADPSSASSLSGDDDVFAESYKVQQKVKVKVNKNKEFKESSAHPGEAACDTRDVGSKKCHCSHANQRHSKHPPERRKSARSSQSSAGCQSPSKDQQPAQMRSRPKHSHKSDQTRLASVLRRQVSVPIFSEQSPHQQMPVESRHRSQSESGGCSDNQNNGSVVSSPELSITDSIKLKLQRLFKNKPRGKHTEKVLERSMDATRKKSSFEFREKDTTYKQLINEIMAKDAALLHTLQSDLKHSFYMPESDVIFAVREFPQSSQRSVEKDLVKCETDVSMELEMMGLCSGANSGGRKSLPDFGAPQISDDSKSSSPFPPSDVTTALVEDHSSVLHGRHSVNGTSPSLKQVAAVSVRSISQGNDCGNSHERHIGDQSLHYSLMQDSQTARHPVLLSDQMLQTSEAHCEIPSTSLLSSSASSLSQLLPQSPKLKQMTVSSLRQPGMCSHDTAVFLPSESALDCALISSSSTSYTTLPAQSTADSKNHNVITRHYAADCGAHGDDHYALNGGFSHADTESHNTNHSNNGHHHEVLAKRQSNIDESQDIFCANEFSENVSDSQVVTASVSSNGPILDAKQPANSFGISCVPTAELEPLAKLETVHHLEKVGNVKDVMTGGDALEPSGLEEECTSGESFDSDCDEWQRRTADAIHMLQKQVQKRSAIHDRLIIKPTSTQERGSNSASFGGYTTGLNGNVVSSKRQDLVSQFSDGYSESVSDFDDSEMNELLNDCVVPDKSNNSVLLPVEPHYPTCKELTQIKQTRSNAPGLDSSASGDSIIGNGAVNFNGLSAVSSPGQPLHQQRDAESGSSQNVLNEMGERCDDQIEPCGSDPKQEVIKSTASEACSSSKENSGGKMLAAKPDVDESTPPTYHRYYHVFREGELVQLIEKYVSDLHILDCYFDHSNWCVVAEKVNVWKI